MLGKEEGGKSVAGTVESNGLGDTGIAEPLADREAGAGIAMEVEDGIGGGFVLARREEESRIPAQRQVEHLPGLDHPLLYLEALPTAADIAPDKV